MDKASVGKNGLDEMKPEIIDWQFIYEAGVVAKHGGNWEKSHMTELAGKFAGIVLVTAPSSAVEALATDL